MIERAGRLLLTVAGRLLLTVAGAVKEIGNRVNNRTRYNWERCGLRGRGRLSRIFNVYLRMHPSEIEGSEGYRYHPRGQGAHHHRCTTHLRLPRLLPSALIAKICMVLLHNRAGYGV